MFRRFFWFRGVDDSCSVLLWADWVCLCLLVVPILLDFSGVDGYIGKFDLVPRAVVVGPDAETCGMVVAVTENDT